MADFDLEAVEARASAAAPGPWKVKYEGGGSGSAACDSYYDVIDGDGLEVIGHSQGNAAFIAAARTDVPALVARVRELEAVLATAERERDLWHAEADVQANAVAAARAAWRAEAFRDVAAALDAAKGGAP